VKIKIEGWEDRSGAATPGSQSFGYVYFSDGSRVGYAPEVPDHLPVWQPRTNGGGRYQEVTWEHCKMAIERLHEEGVLTDADITRLTRPGPE
jgi:hypothetical protein